MKKKLYSILAMLLLMMITTSTVYAGGYVRLTGAPSSGSPLHLDGYLTGLGGYPQGVSITLIGSGVPVTTCTSPGGNQAPGQNPAQVTTSGSTSVTDPDIIKNGKAPVSVVTEDLIGTTLPGKQGGCPNNRWTATIDSIAWTHATVWVYDNANGNWLYHAEYSCHLRDGSTTAYDCTLTFEEFNH